MIAKKFAVVSRLHGNFSAAIGKPGGRSARWQG
jgi:hypothetical protein